MYFTYRPIIPVRFRHILRKFDEGIRILISLFAAPTLQLFFFTNVHDC
jgi:hypothetical protein